MIETNELQFSETILKLIKNLIKRIKEIQDLPEEIIYKFINAAGSLSNTDFAKRFDNEK